MMVEIHLMTEIFHYDSVIVFFQFLDKITLNFEKSLEILED